MRIGLVAEKTGVTRDAIRLYESMGLIKSATRPNEYNNYKEYTDYHVEQINFIVSMKHLGFTLKQCKEVLDHIQSDNFNEAFKSNFLNQKIEEIESKINALQALKEKLEQFKDYQCDGSHSALISKSENGLSKE